MKILVTGSSGFIGLNLEKHFHGKGQDIVTTSRSAKHLGDLKSHFEVDLVHREQVDELLKIVQPTHLINLAGTRERGFVADNSTNQVIAENLFKAAEKVPSMKKFIHIGSADEYGLAPRPYSENSFCKPLGSYALSKHSTSTRLCYLAESGDLDLVIVRPSVVYGAGQKIDMFIPWMIDQLNQNGPISLTSGEQLRDFIHVDDLVDGIDRLISLDQKKRVEIVNFASGYSTSIKSVSIALSNLIRGHDEGLVFGAVPNRANEIFDYRVSNAHARDILRWEPQISLEDGLARLVVETKYR